jgi:hypothetical protein
MLFLFYLLLLIQIRLSTLIGGHSLNISISQVPWIQVSRSRSMLLSVEAKAFAITVTIGVYAFLSDLTVVLFLRLEC